MKVVELVIPKAETEEAVARGILESYKRMWGGATWDGSPDACQISLTKPPIQTYEHLMLLEDLEDFGNREILKVDSKEKQKTVQTEVNKKRDAMKEIIAAANGSVKDVDAQLKASKKSKLNQATEPSQSPGVAPPVPTASMWDYGPALCKEFHQVGASHFTHCQEIIHRSSILL